MSRQIKNLVSTIDADAMGPCATWLSVDMFTIYAKLCYRIACKLWWSMYQCAEYEQKPIQYILQNLTVMVTVFPHKEMFC